jgi:two-component system chemotaxis sensor kinase CheA
VAVAPAPAAEFLFTAIPEGIRLEAYRQGADLWLLRYRPEAGCFFQGDDPFHQARRSPGLLWGAVQATEAWPPLESLDAYRCVLEFTVLSSASREDLEDHYRYVLDQVRLDPVPALALALPQGHPNGGPVYGDFVAEALGHLGAGRLEALGRAARVLLELSNPELWLSSALRWLLAVLDREPEDSAALKALVESLRTLEPPRWEPAASAPAPAASVDGDLEARAREVLAVQRQILSLQDQAPWLPGRLRAAAAAVEACQRALGQARRGLPQALEEALETGSGQALLDWMDEQWTPQPAEPASTLEQESETPPALETGPERDTPPAGEEVKFGRRADDAVSGAKSLKVDQAKVDRLMNLIGEMVVSKNALPYLANRAEAVFGVRELSREIKAQYAVINRIAEEMQDAIMQVRMMPVSFVFQRFPRLVRDTSRKLGKEVNLILHGEATQADKNIIEALGDPLVHIVRNSLDHGLERPEIRRAAGKPATGTLTLRASQESDRVLIEIEDDGKGIDPGAVKRKAYERGLIDEAALERLTDAEAVNLIFAPGLSTADVVSDLSGRGVGMDAVRTAVEKVNGTVHLTSHPGQGTRITLSLPLSMAVTNVMIVETDGQSFGVPMDAVIETVRLPQARVVGIKNSQAALLRGRIVALKSLNAALGLPRPPRVNADGELAVLVVRLGDEPVGLIVDGFHEVVDVILKPMAGVLGGLPAYAGSALMGDGSVLMVLDVKEIL